VPIIFSSLATGIPFIQAGSLVALAVTSKDRVPALSEVPTVAEAGIPGYAATAWYAFVAPAGTPSDIVDTLNAAARKALEAPSMKRLLDQAGAIPSPTTPAELAEFVKGEIGYWKPIIEKSGAKVD
jgi:tripartite-type tricarboxylate transporter receptor subunit TctC